MSQYLANYLNNLPNGIEKTEVIEALVKAILIGLSDDPDLSTGEKQFEIGTLTNIVNRWKMTGGVVGSSPLLEIIGEDINIIASLVAKGLGGFVFGNGAGTLLDVRMTGTDTVRSLIAEVSSAKVELRASVGDLTLGSIAALSVTGAATVGGKHRTTGRISANYSAQNPASGSTVTTAPDAAHLIIATGGVTLAALTVVLPSTPVDGDIFSLSSDCTITALTVQAGSQTVIGAPSTMNAQTPLKWKFYNISSANKWMRMA